MKALTICQPFAHLICLSDDDDRNKRVENRTWETLYRGPLLIHAGKSKEWLTGDDYGFSVADLDFGAVIGVADLRDCLHLECLDQMSSVRVTRVPESAKRRWPWLEFHQHTEGPFCLVLQECRRFKTPILYKGAQGLFNVPKEVVAEQLLAVGR